MDRGSGSPVDGHRGVRLREISAADALIDGMDTQRDPGRTPDETTTSSYNPTMTSGADVEPVKPPGPTEPTIPTARPRRARGFGALIVVSMLSAVLASTGT